MKRVKRDRDVLKTKKVDIRPLDQREHPINTRKGMPRVKCKGFFDATQYSEQLLFPEL